MHNRNYEQSVMPQESISSLYYVLLGIWASKRPYTGVPVELVGAVSSQLSTKYRRIQIVKYYYPSMPLGLAGLRELIRRPPPATAAGRPTILFQF